MKFGGTSIEDGVAFARVAKIVRERVDERPVVVASAISCVTDALIACVRMTAKDGVVNAVRSLEPHFERHLQVARMLGRPARTKLQILVDHTRREIADILSDTAAAGPVRAQSHDLIASYGERLSANLLMLVLREVGVPASYLDARECVLTDERHGCARPLIRETYRRTRNQLKPLLREKRVPVLGGFIASDRAGGTTTMGRGSSDLTATIVSAALGARETQIWTDVDGVLTADPQLVSLAFTVAQLSYTEAAELARLGSRVLYSKMIQPVIKQGIPIRVCNAHAPEKSGTLICECTNGPRGSVKAIAHTPNITAIEITSTPSFVANGFMRALKRSFQRHQLGFEIIGASNVGVSLACLEEELPPSLIRHLRRLGSVVIERRRSIVACIGAGLKEPGSSGHCDQIKAIDPNLKWQSTSQFNLVATVASDSARPTIKDLHYALFGR